MTSRKVMVGPAKGRQTEKTMQKIADAMIPRTTTDIVFDQLYDEIASLRLLPGSRISEAEIAAKMGVSRQPVRDAFNRLGNLGLLLIRPQRATEVRGFSMPAIQNARFVRLAVELEVITRAATSWTADHTTALSHQIERQQAAIASGETSRFHELDYDFHKLICEFSGYPLAFETIQDCKRAVDRLCVLSLRDAAEVTAVLQDHEAILKALSEGSVQEARAATERHLARLDATIVEIHEKHAAYFE